MKVRHALVVGFGFTLVAVLGVVLMAFLMLSRLAGSWTEMSTVIASRHEVMLNSALRLGYASEHFNNYVREGGDAAIRFGAEMDHLAANLVTYRALGTPDNTERPLLDSADRYVRLYREDMVRLVTLRAAGQADPTTLQATLQGENDKLLALVLRKLTDINARRTEAATAQINHQIDLNRIGLLLAAAVASGGVIIAGMLAARSIVGHDRARESAFALLDLDLEGCKGGGPTGTLSGPSGAIGRGTHACTTSSQPDGGRGQSGQVRVSRQHEPRNPHTAERHRRPEPPPAAQGHRSRAA